jgi:hypothetical protein
MQTQGLVGKFLPLALLLCLPLSSSAQVIFTLTATANDNNLGYVMGNTYTFVLTTGSSFGNTASSTFNSTRNFWSEEVNTDDQLWSSIGGTGLSASYIRPSEDSGATSSSLKIDSPRSFLLGAGSNAFLGEIGVKAPNGSTLGGIEFTITSDTGTFDFSSAYTQPNTYFGGVNGTYTPVTAGWGRVYLPNVVSGSQAEFTFTSLTISGGAAVPEPAAYAALAGLAALGLALVRRRAA